MEDVRLARPEHRRTAAEMRANGDFAFRARMEAREHMQKEVSLILSRMRKSKKAPPTAKRVRVKTVIT